MFPETKREREIGRHKKRGKQKREDENEEEEEERESLPISTYDGILPKAEPARRISTRVLLILLFSCCHTHCVAVYIGIIRGNFEPYVQSSCIKVTVLIPRILLVPLDKGLKSVSIFFVGLPNTFG